MPQLAADCTWNVPATFWQVDISLPDALSQRSATLAIPQTRHKLASEGRGRGIASPSRSVLSIAHPYLRIKNCINTFVRRQRADTIKAN